MHCKDLYTSETFCERLLRALQTTMSIAGQTKGKRAMLALLLCWPFLRLPPGYFTTFFFFFFFFLLTKPNSIEGGKL